MAPQYASAEHHKAHRASEDSSSGSTKLPETVIGGMIVDGYIYTSFARTALALL
jgi:hypothetical protein